MRRILLLALLAGCVDGPVTAEADGDLESANRLSSNALSANRLSSNRLSSNGLADAASAATLSDLVSTSGGRELLTYLVSCALLAGQTITATDSLGAAWTFGGSLGLAPAWYASAPSVTDRRWVTACLLARTNAFGVTVPLSLRGARPELAAPPAEKAAYPNFEAIFYGDLWATEPRPMLVCQGKYAATDPSTSSFPLRKCSDGSVVGEATPCGFTWMGACETTCTNGNTTTCPDQSGTAWSEIIQVYLAK